MFSTIKFRHFTRKSSANYHPGKNNMPSTFFDCPTVGGHMILQRPHLGGQVAERWITHDNMWLRRAAILHQLGWKEKTDRERLFRFCLMRCHEEDFFIRKAIGWALREYARTEPVAVRSFVMKNSHSLSSLSRKEALKHLWKVWMLENAFLLLCICALLYFCCFYNCYFA